MQLNTKTEHSLINLTNAELRAIQASIGASLASPVLGTERQREIWEGIARLTASALDGPNAIASMDVRSNSTEDAIKEINDKVNRLRKGGIISGS